jgi:hypothetical protein
MPVIAPINHPTDSHSHRVAMVLRCTCALTASGAQPPTKETRAPAGPRPVQQWRIVRVHAAPGSATLIRAFPLWLQRDRIPKCPIPRRRFLLVDSSNKRRRRLVVCSLLDSVTLNLAVFHSHYELTVSALEHTPHNTVCRLDALHAVSVLPTQIGTTGLTHSRSLPRHISSTLTSWSAFHLRAGFFGVFARR